MQLTYLICTNKQKIKQNVETEKCVTNEGARENLRERIKQSGGKQSTQIRVQANDNKGAQ